MNGKKKVLSQPNQFPLEKQLSIYIHVPFCTRKCDYCHFYVVRQKQELINSFLLALEKEWLLLFHHLEGYTVKSIYFGGGTPSLLPPEAVQKNIETAFSLLSPAKDGVEITLEVNPETVDPSKMQAFFQAGINRVSVGVQSFEENMLKLLGRTHNSAEAIKALETIAHAGIKNISIDLMYDLPNQTLAIWESSLKQALELPISHVSLYNLTIEPYTAFYKIKKKLETQMPDELLSSQMYSSAIEKLTDSGFNHYEISAFARPSANYSIHNSGYWTGRPFLGLGPSAFSYWQGKRWRNKAHLLGYQHDLSKGLSPIDFVEERTFQEQKRERLVIFLRLLGGVPEKEFTKLFGSFDSELVESIDGLIQLGFLQRNGPYLALTRRGIFCYDAVAVELI